MTKITEYLAEQKRLAEAATEGPWEVDQTEPGIWCPKRIVIGNYTAADMFESPAWEDGTPEDLAFIAAARESVPRLVAALEAVSETHRPVEIEPSGTICHECSFQLPNGRYFGKVTEYPCPTVRAIEVALGGEDDA